MKNPILLRDIMVPIEEYDFLNADSNLGDVLDTLKKQQQNIESGTMNGFHTVCFVTDNANQIIGVINLTRIIYEFFKVPVSNDSASSTPVQKKHNKRIKESHLTQPLISGIPNSLMLLLSRFGSSNRQYFKQA
ncbi:hypothetical protein ACFL6N_01970 [Thermodesulfobacteriota bacterium]